MEKHHLAEVSLAEHIIAASSFTKRGLLELGVGEEQISVVPYGCPAPNTAATPPTVQQEFLFVGQGIKRKGLHLLIEAWRRARLKDMRLRVVASKLDPQIADYAQDIPSIMISPRISKDELKALMAASDTFVMPSLVEGFGLVFGEALAQGCRLIGSTNTGVPDYHLDESISTTVPAGKVESLTEALRAAAASMNPKRPYWQHAIAAAEERGWSAFRAGIARAVSQAGRAHPQTSPPSLERSSHD